jgi:hypothetical protein
MWLTPRLWYRRRSKFNAMFFALTLPHRRASSRALSCYVYFIGLRLVRPLVDRPRRVIRQARGADAVVTKRQGDEGDRDH